MVSVYFAGELFSLKHLVGNAALAEAIARLSDGRFVCVLPQSLEDRAMSAHEIRDQDIVALLGCDLAIFNFDGPELDSGTVAEFMLAKFADVPSLLLRTDFRRGGDQGGDPWNLMMSFYPRTKTLCLNSLEIYKSGLKRGLSPVDAGQSMVDSVAHAIVKELEMLSQFPPIMVGEVIEPVFRWISQFTGFQSSESIEKVTAALTKRKRRLIVPN
jgi:nucleoside 2-deoxyribosyltransferase-like protein